MALEWWCKEFEQLLGDGCRLWRLTLISMLVVKACNLVETRSAEEVFGWST